MNAAVPVWVSAEFEQRARDLRVSVGAAVAGTRSLHVDHQPAPEVALNLACPTAVAKAALGTMMFQGLDVYLQTEAGFSHPKVVEAMQRAILAALAEYARPVEADAAAAARQIDAARRAEQLEDVRRAARIRLHERAIEQAAGVRA